MGLFRRNNNDKEQIELLRQEIRSLRERLDAADAAKARLEERADEADVAKARLEARVDATDASKARLERRVTSLDEMSRQIDHQAGNVKTLTTQVRRLAEHLARKQAVEAAKAAGDPTPPEGSPLAGPEAGLVSSHRVEEIEQRLADLDEVNERLDALSQAVTRQANEAMAAGDSIDPGQISDMANRLEDLSVAIATHGTQLEATRERVDEIEQLVPSADTSAETQHVVDDMRRQLGQMSDRVDSLDARLTNVSTELANQLTELSRDIDAAAERPTATLPPPMAQHSSIDDLETDELELRLAEKFDMAIDEVRESQLRLATEQARYEIKFREDLAELAERLRRPRP